MRIAYVISTLDQCGPVNVLYGMAANLCDANEIVVFTLAPEPKGSRAGDFEELGIAVKCVVGGRAQSFLFGRRVLLRALEEFGPDVVHSHGFRATVLCCDLPYPKIVTVHNCIYEDYLTTYGRAKATWMTRLEVAALRRFDEVVACSESNADYLHTEYGLTTSVVRNGVDQTKFFPLTAKPRKELRKRLGISDDALALVATGGCSERKRTLPLAEAFSSALKETGTDAVLHVFGEGPDYVRCRSLGIPCVYFHGFVADVVPWLQACDLFVSASASEGMPLAVLEAISCGLPVLLSDIPSHREIAKIVAKEECARLFDAFNARACTEGIALTLSSVPRRPCDVSLFGADRMAQQYLQEYKAVFR